MPQDQIVAVTGDPEAKRMGIAKAGGEWYKSPKTDALYRVDKVDGQYKLQAGSSVSISSDTAGAGNSPAKADAAKRRASKP